jgi:hypothetical protein
MRRQTIASLCVALLAISTLRGCAIGCIEQPLPSQIGLVIRLADHDTGEMIGNATILAESGEYRTWVVDSELKGYYWGIHKPGTYKVTITQEGYPTKVLDRQIVLPDRGGVHETSLQLELQREN